MWQTDIFAQRCIFQNFCPSTFLTPRFSLRRDKSFVLFTGPSNRHNERRAQIFATSRVMLLVLRPLVLCLKLIFFLGSGDLGQSGPIWPTTLPGKVLSAARFLEAIPNHIWPSFRFFHSSRFAESPVRAQKLAILGVMLTCFFFCAVRWYYAWNW